MGGGGSESDQESRRPGSQPQLSLLQVLLSHRVAGFLRRDTGSESILQVTVQVSVITDIESQSYANHK